MAEKAVYSARAVVYYFDSAKKSWAPTPVGNDFSRVDIYENTQTNSYRVIGRGLVDTSKVVINSNITKDTAYTRASDTFHQWSDPRYIYGLNFPSTTDATTFGGGFESVINKLKSGGTAAPAPAPAAPATQAPTPPATPKPAPAPSPPATPAAPAAPATPVAPAAPAAPAAPPAPAAPAAPKPPSGGPPPPPGGAPPPPGPPPPAPSGESRGALLGSITGFNKGALKKVDKSDPLLAVKPEAPKPDSGASSTGPSAASSGGSAPPPGSMMAAMLAQRSKMLSGTKKSTPPPSNSGGSVKEKDSPAAPANPFKESPSKATPTPPPKSREAMKDSGGSQSSSNGNLSAELATLKEEILAEVRKELQMLKDEILIAIQNK